MIFRRDRRFVRLRREPRSAPNRAPARKTARLGAAQKPHEFVAAVPVASPERLQEVRRWCDEAVCLLSPVRFWAVGQFYAHFPRC